MAVPEGGSRASHGDGGSVGGRANKGGHPLGKGSSGDGSANWRKSPTGGTAARRGNGVARGAPAVRVGPRRKMRPEAGQTGMAVSDMEQAICAVGLVKAKPGVFIEAIQHLIVLATPVELVLLSVCCSGNGVGGDPFTELTLQPLPQYTIPTGGVTLTSITHTDSGRIDLGKNGEGAPKKVAEESQVGKVRRGEVTEAAPDMDTG